MFGEIESEEAGEPEDGEDGDGGQDELGVMQEWERVVAKERDDDVVTESQEVEGIAEQERDPVLVSSREEGLN